MIHRRYEYLVIPRASRFFHARFALRLLRCRWKSITLALLFIAGPVALAMWVVPYSASTLVNVRGLGPDGLIAVPKERGKVFGF